MNYKYSIFSLLAMAASLSGCSDDEFYDTLSGTPEKTPLSVSTILNLNGSVQTRAVNKEFAKNDEFFACLRHVIDNGTVTEVTPDPATDDYHVRAYATFKLNENPTATDKDGVNVYHITEDFILTSLKYGSTTLNSTTTPKAALYWDDFSTSTSEDTDLRTANHKLQSYYAYCFNGASAGAEGQYTLTESTGALSWNILSDQKELANFTKSDLLWSTPQPGVAYGHKSSVDDASRDGLVIPFTHALSKISVNVLVDTDAGFIASDNLFSNVDVVLSAFRTSCTLNPTATSGELISFDGSSTGNITMRKVETTETSGTYEAIVVPSLLKLDNLFATVVVDGNSYNIPVSASMLQEATPDNNNKGWGTKLTAAAESNYQMQQGVNYVLEVTLKKTKIGVRAEIRDWDKITATGQGDINFTDDVTEIVITPTITTGSDVLSSFDLWRSVYDKENADARNYDEDAVADGVNKATTTTVTIDGENTTYTNDPEIYWPNGSTSYFFRALSKKDSETGTFVSVDNSFDATQGTDLLWATTSAHKDKNSETTYSASDPINPRTGPVPMTFEHAMSKITVNLETSKPSTDGGATPADAVVLAGATISIANIYHAGTIALEDGKITPINPTELIPISGLYAANDESDGATPKLSEYVVVPQSLVKMADGETDRDGAVAFWNVGELTKIDDTYYVTSTLDKITYSEEDANSKNATLDGHRKTTDVKTPAVLYTEDDVIAEDAKLDGAVKVGDPKYYTLGEFQNLTNKQISEDLFNKLTETQKAKHYTYDEYIALPGNEAVTPDQFKTLSEEQTIKKTADDKIDVYTYVEYQGLAADLKPFSGFDQTAFDALTPINLKQNGVHDAASAKAYNAALPGTHVTVGSVKTPAETYTQEEVDAYNATLPGAVRAGDVKEYSVNGDSKQANPGDLKTPVAANPKIMMLITLADGTTYSLDLASCKDTTSGEEVKQWKRGEHYTYTIKLTKSDITFRAMVKDWVEKTTSGNATLEWD